MIVHNAMGCFKPINEEIFIEIVTVVVVVRQGGKPQSLGVEVLRNRHTRGHQAEVGGEPFAFQSGEPSQEVTC